LPPRNTARTLGHGLLGGALLLLTGCSVGGALIPSGAPTHSVEGSIEAARLAVGDCVDALTGDILAGLDAVPCTEKHDWEVYFTLSVDGAADTAGITGGDAVVAAAEEGCGGAFWPFVGLPTTTTSALGYTYLVSGADSDDPVVHCLIGDMSGPVSGSLAGAAR
jgi:hypothetical protein